MGVAVKSDGKVNNAVLALSQAIFAGHAKADIDALLIKDNLKQCTLETLCLAMYAYSNAFGEKNWLIQEYLEIKAWQSDTYRNLVNSKKNKKDRSHLALSEESQVDDPIAVLQRAVKVN